MSKIFLFRTEQHTQSYFTGLYLLDSFEPLNIQTTALVVWKSWLGISKLELIGVFCGLFLLVISAKKKTMFIIVFSEQKTNFKILGVINIISNIGKKMIILCSCTKQHKAIKDFFGILNFSSTGHVVIPVTHILALFTGIKSIFYWNQVTQTLFLQRQQKENLLY